MQQSRCLAYWVNLVFNRCSNTRKQNFLLPCNSLDAFQFFWKSRRLNRCDTSIKRISSLLLIYLLLNFSSAYATSDPKSVLVTLSGTTARANLAHLLILLAECRLNRAQNDCPTALSSAPLPDAITQKDVTNVDLYEAARARGIWPQNSDEIGTEEIFENYFLGKFREYGNAVFPEVGVNSQLLTSRAPIWVKDGEDWPNSPDQLSTATKENVCKTFTRAIDSNCIVKLEPRMLTSIKQDNATRQFLWRSLPGFVVTFRFSQPLTEKEVSEVVKWLETKLMQRIEKYTGSQPYSEDISISVSTFSKIPNAPIKSFDQNQMSSGVNEQCDLRSRIDWPEISSGLKQQPIFIADLDSTQDDYKNYWDQSKNQIDLTFLDKLQKCDPASPEHIEHSLAVAAVISGLLPVPERFIFTSEALNPSSKDNWIPVTVVPGKLNKNFDRLEENERKLLFSGTALDAPSFSKKTLEKIAHPNEGTLPVIAVPQKDNVKEEVFTEMVNNSRDFRYSSLNTDPLRYNWAVRPYHDLQNQPTKRSCSAWPICLATTPFAMGVAALDSDNKHLLSPDDYLLGAGWTWIAAPGTMIPGGIKAKAKACCQQEKEITGSFTGSSFSAPIVGATVQAIMNELSENSSVSVFHAAALIAASSDLASRFEMVGKKKFIELVRFGRLNSKRALSLAKKGALTQPVLLKSEENIFESGKSLRHNSILDDKEACEADGEFKLLSPKVQEDEEGDSLLAPLVYKPGETPFCLDSESIARISLSRDADGNIIQDDGYELDVVYLLKLSISTSGSGYPLALSSYPLPVVLRGLRIPKRGNTAVCEVVNSAPNDACFTFIVENPNNNIPIDFENMDYFGKFIRIN